MDTDEIMQIALEMAGFDETPSDSMVYVPGRNIEKVIMTLDPDPSLILLAKELKYDLVISHHYTSACIDAWKVFRKHIDQMVSVGIPKEKAEKIVEKKLVSLEITGHAKNYDLVDSIARKLKVPFMNIHNPLDELGRKIMQDKVDEVIRSRSGVRVKDVIEGLYQLEEFQFAKTKILIGVGDPDNNVSKVIVSHGALTNGGYEVANAYFDHGVDTVIYIHIAPNDLLKLKAENKGNLIISGHIASDSVGINPFVKRLEKEGLEVLKLGGIIPPSV